MTSTTEVDLHDLCFNVAAMRHDKVLWCVVSLTGGQVNNTAAMRVVYNAGGMLQLLLLLVAHCCVTDLGHVTEPINDRLLRY
jgi:hypothetical protein